MNFRHIQILLQQSKYTTHLLQIHSLILKTAFDYDAYILSNLILSSSSISLHLATLIFHNSPITPPLFAWNTIIKEYSKSPTPFESINLFSQLQKTGTVIKPDKFTFPFVLKSCGRCSMLAVGGSVHSSIVKASFDSDRYINNTLLRMYAACGAIGFARQVFDEMPERDVVSWSAMIAGYITCNHPSNALSVFLDMKRTKEAANSVTLVSLLSVCTHLVNVKMGRSIHSYILTNDIKFDVPLATALLEMYATCGYIDTALAIFDSMNDRNLQSWTVMVSGLAENGRGEEAIALFGEMEGHGLTPDGVSFSAILCACSHLGRVHEGQRWFDRMVNFYKIRPTMEHYGCMVDMYGRSGMIEEAYGVIKSMPMEPNSIVLRSFVSACKNHGSSGWFDENVMKNLLKIEPDVGANYVLSASVCSMLGDWDEVDEVRGAMKGKGLTKVPGCSWVEGKRVSDEGIVGQGTR